MENPKHKYTVVIACAKQDSKSLLPEIILANYNYHQQVPHSGIKVKWSAAKKLLFKTNSLKG
jgi:hypothetical protein